MSRVAGVVCRLLLLLTFGAVVSWPSVAGAEATAEELKEARETFFRAVELEQAGNWAGALRLFRDVSQVKMTPQVRFHIALCEEKLGKLVAALGGYELALADADEVGGTFREEVEEKTVKLRDRIPKLIIERGKGAEAARIELDGIELGASSIGVEAPVDPGPHQITATAKGYEDFTRNVSLQEQAVETVVVELKNVPKSPPATKDDDGGAASDAPRREPQVVPIALMAGGGAVMAAGGVALLLAQIDFSDVESQCTDGTCPDDLRPKFDKALTKRTVGLVTLGVGAAAAAAGAILFFTDVEETIGIGRDSRANKKPTGKKKTSRVRIIPAAPDAEAGLSLHGRF